MSQGAASEQRPSGWAGIFGKRTTKHNEVVVTANTDQKPDSKPQAPMKGYKPRYADRDALLCIAPKDRESSLTQKSYEWRQRKSRVDIGFDRAGPSKRLTPSHPNGRISMGGMPSYIAPPLSRTPTSPASSSSSSQEWSVDTPVDEWSLDSRGEIAQSASARLEDNSKDYFGEPELQKLSLAAIRRELRTEAKRPPRLQRSVTAMEAPASTQTYALPVPYSGKGKQKVADLRVPSIGHYRASGLQHKRFSPVHASISGRLDTTPEEIELEEMTTAPLPSELSMRSGSEGSPAVPTVSITQHMSD